MARALILLLAVAAAAARDDDEDAAWDAFSAAYSEQVYRETRAGRRLAATAGRSYRGATVVGGVVRAVVRHAGVVRRALGLAPEPDLPSYCRNGSHADESRADAVQAAARAAAEAVAAALANSTATVRAALAEGAARGVEVAAARDRARAAPRRDSGATYCGQRPGYRCRGHGSEKRCHPDASCN